MRTMSHQLRVNIIKRKQLEILWLKSTITNEKFSTASQDLNRTKNEQTKR